MFNDYGTPQTKDLSVSTNRKAFSAGTKRSIGKTEYNSIVKCKRALHYGYNSEMEVTIHEYAKRGLTQLVQIPYTQNAQEMAKEGIKLILLNAYELMTDLHYEGKSLKGLFSSKNFLISLHSKKVKLQDIEILPYSKGDSRIDKSQFITMTKDLFGDDVPVEIICWLECIAEDAPDNVIRHHINMLHANDIFGEFFSMFHIMLKIKSLDKNAYNKVLKSLKCYSSWQRKINWCILKDNYERQCGAYEANGFGFMQLIRNTFVHPAKIYQELLLAVVVGEQPKFLSDMQLAIYSIGYLPQLDRKNLD